MNSLDVSLSCSSASVSYILNHVEILSLCSFLSCVAIATDQMGKTDKLKALVTCGNQGQCDQKLSSLDWPLQCFLSALP